jgi:hypothetical protein
MKINILFSPYKSGYNYEVVYVYQSGTSKKEVM